MAAADNAPIITIRSRPDRRAWLAANHATPATRASRISHVTDSAAQGLRRSPFRR